MPESKGPEWEFLDFTIQMQIDTIWFEELMKKLEALNAAGEIKF